MDTLGIGAKERWSAIGPGNVLQALWEAKSLLRPCRHTPLAPPSRHAPRLDPALRQAPGERGAPEPGRGDARDPPGAQRPSTGLESRPGGGEAVSKGSSLVCPACPREEKGSRTPAGTAAARWGTARVPGRRQRACLAGPSGPRICVPGRGEEGPGRGFGRGAPHRAGPTSCPRVPLRGGRGLSNPRWGRSLGRAAGGQGRGWTDRGREGRGEGWGDR